MTTPKSETPPPSDPSVFDLELDAPNVATPVVPKQALHDQDPSSKSSGSDKSSEQTSAADDPRGKLAGPAAYLTELCQQTQIVLLGDQRYVSQHLEFLAAVLPDLHAAGVTNLAWEFTNTRVQDQLDALLAAPQWNRSLCNDLFVDLLGVGFGYQQYADVLEAAWRLNSRLGPDDQPLRVIGLGAPSYVEDPELLDGRSAGELDLRNWWMGGHYRDITAFHMANVLTTEVIRRGERAVVYGDTERTTTQLMEWIGEHPATSLGNLLHRWMDEGVQRVLFHGALNDDAALDRIEALIDAAPEDANSFGLDIGRSTLGNVGVPAITGCIAGEHTEFRLGDVADGYLFIAPRAQWRPVDLIQDFIAPRNLRAAEMRYRALDPRTDSYTLDELELVRIDGHTDVEASWPSVPEPVEESEETGRKWFRRG
ncbi:MAG: hypothetical protein ACKVHU_16965 [Acidimicrobiales bacterium]